MRLCHQAGTVACICVLFGLKTLPDIHGPVVPSSQPCWAAVRRRAETCRVGWRGAVLPSEEPQRGAVLPTALGEAPVWPQGPKLRGECSHPTGSWG